MSKTYSFTEKNAKIIVCLFFLIYFFIGVSVFDDYGTHYDEIDNHKSVPIIMEYVQGKNKDYLSHYMRYYGPVFELIRYGVQNALHLTDIRDIFLMRHFLIFLIFFCSVICFYKICQTRFLSWKMGLLGSLFLILSPRIFAHSFYNNKDLVFLSFFLIATFSAIRYLRDRNFRWAILHALASAILIDVRILGIFIPVFTSGFFFADFLFISDKRKHVGRQCLSFLCYFGMLICLVILFRPFLWDTPVARFIEVFNEMKKYPWGGNVLYLGEIIGATRLPWHYIPVWLSITTPISYLVFFIVGFLGIIGRFCWRPISFYCQHRNDLLYLCCFLVPLVMVIVLKSVLYDAWRHLFFIYPCFLIISLIGLSAFYQWVKKRSGKWLWKVIGGVTLLCVLFNILNVVYFMFKYHPYQNVYFNRLAGKNMTEIKRNFELDYWGLSYKQALEYIVEHDDSPSIDIFPLNLPGELNRFFLKKEDRDRLHFVKDVRMTKYFMSNFRMHKDEYSNGGEYFSTKVRGTNIMVVYRRY